MVIPEQNQDAMEGVISADEVALYDRQIRLWGMEAQSRMRNAKILLIGMRAIANETAKNLVLAGIGSLTVLDSEVVTEEDLSSQFFVQEEHLGLNRAEAAAPAIQRLNPRVGVFTDTGKVRDKSAEYFRQFDITIATELDLDTLIYINNCCRASKRPFYSAASFGLYGYIFADLIKHTFSIERDKSNLETLIRSETKTRRIIDVKTKKEGERTKEIVTKEELYTPLEQAIQCPIDPTWRPRKRRTVPMVLPCMLALWQYEREHHSRPQFANRASNAQFTAHAMQALKYLNLPDDLLKSSFIASFLQNCTAELTPVAAVLGGTLAQDVINVLGKREQPLQNLLVFDGDANVGPILALHPEEMADPEGKGKGANGSGKRQAVEVVDLD